MILFKSFETRPTLPPTKAVVAPTNVITSKAVGLYSKIGEHLNNKYKPAVTRVAACNSAETGVGPILCYIRNILLGKRYFL